jgi:putative ABC transport system permease protein
MTLLRDLRFGWRLLWKKPGFTAVAVATLGLGVAANSAIFSVIYGTYLAPLPYRDADRLVMVWSRLQGNREMVAPGDFVEWKRRAMVFDDLQAWTGGQINLATADRPERIGTGPSTPGFLAMLGYGHPLALGRSFLEEEGVPGREQVVILTHRLWSERFAADPNIIGRQVRLDRKPYTVVGVLHAGPPDTNQNQIWLPLAFTPEQLTADAHWLLVMGRLKAGVTLEQASANMAAVSRNLSLVKRQSSSDWSISVEPFRNNFVSDRVKASLWLLVGAVAFVLLIACANVANLLLARGTARRRELAVRASLGASRAGIVRQLIVESLVLAAMGGALGVGLAVGLLEVIVALLPPYTLPTEVEITLNVPVLLFTLGACVLSGLLAGCAPAWQAARANMNDTLKQEGRSMSGGHHGLRRALVVVEFSLALTLLAGGGLAMHGFFKLANTDLGFSPDRLLTFSLPTSEGRFTTTDQINAFYQTLIDRVQILPGIRSASLSVGMPVWGGTFGRLFRVAGQPAVDPSRQPRARFNMVSTGYFRTFGIRITRGRAFTEQDREGSLPVAIVNQAFVHEHLRHVDPLETRLVVKQVQPDTFEDGPDIEWQIVGVSADVRNAGVQNQQLPEIIVPFRQSPLPFVRMAIRTAGEPTSVQQNVAAIIQSIDPELPMASVKTMEQRVGESMAGDRFNTALFGAFAAVALVLAALGIYGVMSFVVAQRTHEIGLRMALGAPRGLVLLQVLREGALTALAGIALGSVGAYFAGRAMQGLVYGVEAMDPAALVIVAFTLVAAALLACLVPARRAASVDPIVALRQD